MTCATRCLPGCTANHLDQYGDMCVVPVARSFTTDGITSEVRVEVVHQGGEDTRVAFVPVVSGNATDPIEMTPRAARAQARAVLDTLDAVEGGAGRIPNQARPADGSP